MYLTRLVLNLRSRKVLDDLADCHKLHRRVLSLFPDVEGPGRARAELGVLFRLDGPVLLIQSRVPPQLSNLPPHYLRETGGQTPNQAVKEVSQQYANIHAGMRLWFRLRANPTRKIDSWRGREGYRPNGRRVDLRRTADQIAWLERKGAQHGFQLLSVATRPDTLRIDDRPVQADARPADRVTGWRSAADGSRQRLTFAAVVFEGVLQVTDADRFRSALESGIGPGKAFGFGLLSVAPIRG